MRTRKLSARSAAVSSWVAIRTPAPAPPGAATLPEGKVDAATAPSLKSAAAPPSPTASTAQWTMKRIPAAGGDTPRVAVTPPPSTSVADGSETVALWAETPRVKRSVSASASASVAVRV